MRKIASITAFAALLGVVTVACETSPCGPAFICGADEDAKKDIDYAYERCVDDCKHGWPNDWFPEQLDQCIAQCGEVTSDVIEPDNGPDTADTTPDDGGGTTDTDVGPDVDTMDVPEDEVTPIDPCENLRMIEGEWRALGTGGEPIAGKATMMITLAPEGAQCRVTMKGYVNFGGDLIGTKLPLERKYETIEQYLLGDEYKLTQKEVNPQTHEVTVNNNYIPECSGSAPPTSCFM